MPTRTAPATIGPTIDFLNGTSNSYYNMKQSCCSVNIILFVNNKLQYVKNGEREDKEEILTG